MVQAKEKKALDYLVALSVRQELAALARLMQLIPYWPPDCTCTLSNIGDSSVC